MTCVWCVCSAPTGPQSRGPPRPANCRHRLHRHRLRAVRDGGRIIVTVLSTLRLPVVAEMSRARWPSSRRARPLAAAAACTGGATRNPSAKQARRRVRACRWRAQVASRAEAGAPLGGHIVGAGAGADGVRAPAACAPVSRVRSQRHGRQKAALAAYVAAGRAGHTCGWWVDVPGLEEVGDEVDRGVDRLGRALVSRRVHGDVCAWVLCVRSGVCGGAVVLISCGAAGRRGRDSGGDRTSN